MIIYIDDEFCCHTSNPDKVYRAFNVSFFDDKCTKLVEGYRYIPAGESWEREDGVVFKGEMISPAVDYTLIGIAQEQYAHDMAEADASYREGVNAV
jgi:hypothetical protein